MKLNGVMMVFVVCKFVIDACTELIIQHYYNVFINMQTYFVTI